MATANPVLGACFGSLRRFVSAPGSQRIAAATLALSRLSNPFLPSSSTPSTRHSTLCACSSCTSTVLSLRSSIPTPLSTPLSSPLFSLSELLFPPKSAPAPAPQGLHGLGRSLIEPPNLPAYTPNASSSSLLPRGLVELAGLVIPSFSVPSIENLLEENVFRMNRNKRAPKAANHGARPCSSVGRKSRRPYHGNGSYNKQEPINKSWPKGSNNQLRKKLSAIGIEKFKSYKLRKKVKKTLKSNRRRRYEVK